MSFLYPQQAGYQPNIFGTTLSQQDIAAIVTKLAAQYPSLLQVQPQVGQFGQFAQQPQLGGAIPGGGMQSPELVWNVVNRIVQTALPLALASLEAQPQVGPLGQFGQQLGQFGQQPWTWQGGQFGMQSQYGGPAFAGGGMPSHELVWAIVSRIVQTALPIVLSSLQAQQQARQFAQLGQPQFAGDGIAGMGIPYTSGAYQTQPPPVNQFAFAH